jgi:ornithine cyclodeaminase
MDADELRVITGSQVEALLDGREEEIVEAVADAYRVHAQGDSTLPHSSFLRFPGERRNRIISLIAYLGGRFQSAGMKWIASFPNNTSHGIARASAVIVLNSMRTGRPQVMMEGSVVSARRTAAGAALAARTLHAGRPERVGVIGCGVISFEILRFLKAVYPELADAVAFDLDPVRAESLAAKAGEELGIRTGVAGSAAEVLARCPLTSLATTAVDPHLDDLSMCPAGATLLHVSLRDLTAEAVLRCDNVVDDVDHVLRAETSVHLAEQRTGSRAHVRCTLADVLLSRAPARRDADSVLVFSPFGLGVLDLAVAGLAADRARDEAVGVAISDFFPGYTPAKSA